MSMEIRTTPVKATPPAPAPQPSRPPEAPAAPSDPQDSVQLSPEALKLAAGNAGGPASYSVQSGDTLGALASDWGVSVDQIAEANGIADPDRIDVGQQLVNPGAAPTAVSAGLAGLASQLKQQQSAPAGYSVQPGDTLSALASQWGVSVEQIAQANGIADPDMIQAGQQLVNPGGLAGRAVPGPAPQPTGAWGVGNVTPPGGSLTDALAGARNLPGAQDSIRAEQASGAIRVDEKLSNAEWGERATALSSNYRDQTLPQIVSVNGVAIPVYGVRTEGELEAITKTLQNSAGVGPEVLNGIQQINLYDKGRFDAPAFYGQEQIFVERPTPGQPFFPNLNHEFGHFVDDQVKAVERQRDAAADGLLADGLFGLGHSPNSYGETSAVEDFAVSFDYATAGFVEGQAPNAATDPEVQAKVNAAMAALAEYQRRYPVEANLAAV